jgi:hypothetical protein
VRGTPRNPMSRAEVIEKARDLTTPILGREKTERLIETAYAIALCGTFAAYDHSFSAAE